MRKTLVAVAAWTLGCGQSAEPAADASAPTTPSDITQTTEAASADREVAALRGRYLSSARAAVIPGVATGFTRAADGWVPELLEAHVQLALPEDASQPFVLGRGAARIAVTLLGARPVPARVGTQTLTYPSALPEGDLVHVPTPDGTEEYFELRAPLGRALQYRVQTTGVAGLRLVDGVLELLDATGDPVLRTAAPWVVDSAGVQRRGTLAVRGCAVDEDARPPWGRAVTPPGAGTCTVEVSVDEVGLAFPVLVDPGWTDTVVTVGRRAFHGAAFFTKSSGACVAPGCVLVAGGNFNGTILDTSEIYSVAAKTWATAGTIPGGARWLHLTEATGEGRVLVAGGCTGPQDFNSPATNTAALYDAAGAPPWKATTAMPGTGRCTGASASVSGRIFASGGSHFAGTTLTTYATMDEYTVSTGVWTARAALAQKRRLHAMAAWNTGGVKVIVAGGFDAATLDTVETWNDGAGAWVGAGKLTGPRYGIATADVGGKVLFAGGLPTTGTPSAEMDAYDKTTFAVTNVGKLTVARGLGDAATFTLGAGVATLIAGGTDKIGASVAVGLTAADTLDAAQKPYPHAMRYARAGNTATSLGASVLVAGGRYGAGPTFGYASVAELFAPAANGTACTASTVGGCASLICTDGVCCDGACAGQCEACSASGKCAPSTTPRTACAGAAGTCGYRCDGTTRDKCTAPGSTTVCVAGSCAFDATTKVYVETQPASCTGAGSCSASVPITKSCGSYTCNGKTCRTSCTTTTDCASGYNCKTGVCVTNGDLGTVCTANNQCKSLFCVDGVCCSTSSCGAPQKCNANGKGTCSLPKGAACSVATACGSGLCKDGVCCDTACTGQCEACNVAGSAGTCIAVSGAPAAPRPACFGTGLCQGKCNGSDRTACKLYPGPETVCAPAACTAGVATTDGRCGGAGSCSASVKTKCEPYACGADTCKASCTINSDCAAGYVCKDGDCQTSGGLGTVCTAGPQCTSTFCVTSDTPGAKVCCSLATCPAGTFCAGSSAGSLAGTCLKQGGEKCTASKDCAGGYCIDGVCCDGACTGQCEACDVVGAEGKCSAITGDPHGLRAKCDDGGPSVCRALACDGSRNRATCVAFKNGPSKECAAATCADGVAVEAGYCNGDGGCDIKAGVSCGAYLCGDKVCRTACTTGADCATGYACRAGKCAPADAATCNTDQSASKPPDGSPDKPCAPYRCNPSTGDCYGACTASDQCAGGAVCDGTHCVAAASATAADGGCGCHTGATGTTPMSALLLLGLVGIAARRRARN